MVNKKPTNTENHNHIHTNVHVHLQVVFDYHDVIIIGGQILSQKLPTLRTMV